MRIDPYHFYCQKVLPAVYDESLSYYEDVCKLLAAMQELDKSMDDLEKRMDALDQISTVLWPQFQAEVTATLQEYAKAYEDFQAGIETDISGFEAQLTAMNTTLTNAINSQNETIAANNVAQMAMLTQRLAAQDEEIESISNTVEQNSQDMADLTADVHNFIAQYSPPATINGLSPQFLIAANAGASLTAVQGLIQLTATADSEGKAVINVSNYGSWSVTSVYQGQRKSVTVSVDDVKQYTVNVEIAPLEYEINVTVTDITPLLLQSIVTVNGSEVAIPSTGVINYTPTSPGEYTVSLMLANVYPDGETYTPASSTGVVLYTTYVSETISITQSQPQQDITLTPPAPLTVSVSASSPLTITSPVSATNVSKSVTPVSTVYSFYRWSNLMWVISQNDITKQVPSNINTMSIIPQTVPTWNSTIPFTRSQITSANSLQTLEDPDTLLSKYNEVMTASNISCGLLDKTGHLITTLPLGSKSSFGTYDFTGNDGCKILSTNTIFGYVIPAFGTTNGALVPYTENNIFPAFIDMNNVKHKGLFLFGNSGVANSNFKYPSHVWSTADSDEDWSSLSPPKYAKTLNFSCFKTNIWQIWLMILIKWCICGSDKYNKFNFNYTSSSASVNSSGDLIGTFPFIGATTGIPFSGSSPIGPNLPSTWPAKSSGNASPGYNGSPSNYEFFTPSTLTYPRYPMTIKSGFNTIVNTEFSPSENPNKTVLYDLIYSGGTQKSVATIAYLD